MPQIRYNERYTYPENLPPEQRILANATIESIPYEVSDEELAVEAEQATCEEYLALSPAVITQPHIWYLMRAFAKKLGYRIL